MISSSCPDAEVVASLAEGGAASLKEREPVLSHLLRCEDCYIAFVETARLAASVAESRTPTRSAAWRPLRPFVPATRLSPRYLVTGLVAAAAVAVAFSVAAWRGRAPSLMAPATASVPGLRPAVSPPAALALAAPSGNVPAWIVSAPWRDLGDARHAFAAAGSDRDALVLGMQIASRDAICRHVAPEHRPRSLLDVAEFLRRRGPLSSEQQELLRRLAAGDCPDRDAAPSGLGSWSELGRDLEGWRIAALVHDPDAFDPARAKRLRELLLLVRLDESVRRRALSLATRPRVAGHAAAWEELQADVQELIDLLCA